MSHYHLAQKTKTRRQDLHKSEGLLTTGLVAYYAVRSHPRGARAGEAAIRKTAGEARICYVILSSL